MVYILTTLWWPNSKSIEVGKKGIEYPERFPADETIAKVILDAGLMRTREGIKAIAVSEVMEGKLEQAIQRTAEVLDFYSEIEGLTCRYDIMATAAEAMASIGLAIPA
ncbi:MAG: hypothetical protein ACXAAH_06840 [Promethearchaeota archaeon]|jgi:hypothetical protein